MSLLSERLTLLAQALGTDFKSFLTSYSSMQSKVAGAGKMLSCFAGGVVPGMFYDQSFTAAASGTIAARSSMDAYPFMVPRDLKIDQIGVNVTTVGSGSRVRLSVYATGANGWPAGILLDTPTIATTAVGYAFATVDFTFQAGVMYWLGIKATGSGLPTLRSVLAAGTRPLGMTSATGISYNNVLSTSAVGGADAASTTPWPTMTAAYAVALASQVAIRMRAAA